MSWVTSPARWLQVIGVSHAVVGIVSYRDVLTGMVRDGVVGTVPDSGERATALWFLLVAPVTWAAGRSLQSAEAHGDATAMRRTGAVVAGAGLAGGVTHPASPLWLVGAVGVAAMARGLRAARTLGQEAPR